MARAQKYSRILEAAKYYAAIDNYVKYITDSTKKSSTSKVGSGKARQPSQKLYIDPFAIALSTGQLVQQSAALPSWTKYAAAFTGRAQATPPTDANLIIPLANYRAARVNITTGRSTTGTKKISRVTGMPYLDYGGASTSIPFGRRNETDTQAAAFTDLRTAILATAAGAIVTLKPEDING
jgi:hypothetical protein